MLELPIETIYNLVVVLKDYRGCFAFSMADLVNGNEHNIKRSDIS